MYNKYSLKSAEGKNNICGKKIKEYRLSQRPQISQEKLAKILQQSGLEIDRFIIIRIENGTRYVTDVEVKAIADALNIPITYLLS